MRISYRVWLVGGIPIIIGAAIAVAAWLLLKEAERARNGAVRASSVYRNLVVAMGARDDYVQALAGDRAEHAVRFGSLAEQVRSDLGALEKLTRDESHRTAASTAREALARYEQQMRQFMVVTTNNDHLASEMRTRVASLITLTDRARERQHAANVELVSTLRQKDRQQRGARDIVDAAHELRAQIAAVALQELLRNYASTWDEIADADRQLTIRLNQLRRAANEIAEQLRGEGRPEVADELTGLVKGYELLVAGSPDPTQIQPEGANRVRAGQNLADWAERLLKVKTAEQRALHEEVSQLVTYSVEANETEQATQNVAIETLKLGQLTAEALSKLDVAGASAVVSTSQKLLDTVGTLPISPLIQTEMMDAIEQWRTRLTTAIEGLQTQNAMIADMDRTASAMEASARSINDLFIAEANRIGRFVLSILVLGATIGLLFGSAAAIIVARSITRPLRSLQQDMLALAGNPLAGRIPLSSRRDELGDMARAANFFVTEIGRREQALRTAKDQADEALIELRRTEAELIQAEKLASLGQLVAGVAHEINTPVGIALTTATTLSEEVQSFAQTASTGQVPRSRFVHFVERMREGSQLLFTNLTRAAELVQSFKQVAADQVSSESRAFNMQKWIHELLTSLRPVLRKSGHEVSVTCPPDLTVDTYPGALAQVLTNLFMNAITHAYAPGRTGHLHLTVEEARPGSMRLTFADDGKGIAPDVLGKVFDPFFTTARNRGSTGLGLHIVYNLVTSVLHGKIEVSSTLGEGTRFTITVPTRIGEAVPEKMLASA